MSALILKKRSLGRDRFVAREVTARVEQAATRHRTPDFVPLSIADANTQKGGGLCGPPKVTRNFESVLVIDDAPIRLLIATVAAPSCEFPERDDSRSSDGQL